MGTPQLWYEWDGEFTFWPKPDAVKNITLYFTAYPDELTGITTQLLSVPDKFYNAVVDYVLMKCYEMDEDSMIRIFSAYRWAQSVSGLPRRILAELVELVDKTLKDKQERVEKMRGSLSRLREVSARLDSAEYDKTTSRGDGIEN